MGPTNADRRVALPVHDLETRIPEMSGVAVVAFEELPDVLAFDAHIARRRKKDI